MKLAHVLTVLTATATVHPASAAVFTYKYEGNILFAGEETDVERFGYTDGPIKITMSIDESLIPGGTLVNAEVRFASGFYGNQLDGIVYYDYQYFNLVDYRGGGELVFSTDSARRIFSWYGFVDDDHPTVIIATGGDALYWTDEYDGYFSGPPGTWTLVDGGGVTPVPVPATLPLLAAGLAAFGLFRRKRAA